VSWPESTSDNADAQLRLVLGQHVVADVVDGLRSFRAMTRPPNSFTVVIGCVAWVTDPDIVNELIRYTACCVVVDKGQGTRHQLDRLVREGPGLHLDNISSSIWRRPGGELSRFGEGGDVESARVLGWRGPSGKPLMHAKVLVLGHGEWTEVDTGEGVFEDYHFHPRMAWIGSANLTTTARTHAELGAWFVGPQVRELAWWVADMVATSEPLSSIANEPTPELREAPEPSWEEYEADVREDDGDLDP
jgi:hypothetical protein